MIVNHLNPDFRSVHRVGFSGNYFATNRNRVLISQVSGDIYGFNDSLNNPTETRLE